MSRVIGSLVASLVLTGTGILAAADVVRLPTQTLTQYNGGLVVNWAVNFQIVPTFRQSAYTGLGPAAGPLGYAPGDQAIETISAPAGERFVITPGPAPTYLHLDADFLHAAGGNNGFGGPSPVSFAGLSGTAPSSLGTIFTAGTDTSLDFSGDWAVPAPFSFTSITFTATVTQEPPTTDTTFEHVDAILFAYEPDPPGSTTDQLLSVQPIPEPSGLIVVLAAPMLLRRQRRSRSGHGS